MQISFTELRSKEVINVLNGKLLGNICDIIIDVRANCVLGVVVPGSKSFFNFFKCNQEIFVPVSSICKIGEDTILVEVEMQNTKRRRKNVKIFDAGDIQEDNKIDNLENLKP